MSTRVKPPEPMSSADPSLSALHLVSADTPLSARLVHPNWQVRLDAYEQIADLFRSASDGDQRLGVEVYGPVFSRILADPNPAACDRALDALLAYIPKRPAELAALAHAVGAILIDKCVPNHRPSIRQKATLAFLSFMQQQQQQQQPGGASSGSCMVVMDCLVSGCRTSRSAKAVAGCVGVIKEAVKTFGHTSLPLQAVLQGGLLPHLFDSREPSVRQAASDLAVELWRWMGPQLRAYTRALRPSQREQLEKQFQAATGGGGGGGAGGGGGGGGGGGASNRASLGSFATAPRPAMPIVVGPGGGLGGSSRINHGHGGGGGGGGGGGRFVQRESI